MQKAVHEANNRAAQELKHYQMQNAAVRSMLCELVLQIPSRLGWSPWPGVA